MTYYDNGSGWDTWNNWSNNYGNAGARESSYVPPWMRGTPVTPGLQQNGNQHPQAPRATQRNNSRQPRGQPIGSGPPQQQQQHQQHRRNSSSRRWNTSKNSRKHTSRGRKWYDNNHHSNNGWNWNNHGGYQHKASSASSQPQQPKFAIPASLNFNAAQAANSLNIPQGTHSMAGQAVFADPTHQAAIVAQTAQSAKDILAKCSAAGTHVPKAVHDFLQSIGDKVKTDTAATITIAINEQNTTLMTANNELQRLQAQRRHIKQQWQDF